MILKVIVTLVIGLALLIAVSKCLYGEDADWWEYLRRRMWPLLHSPLETLGGFSVSSVGESQYVGRVPFNDEDALEVVLRNIGFTRNPWAALKRRKNRKDVSEGSWVDRWNDKWWLPSWLSKYQLHVTIFEREDNDGYDIYAHWERNYIPSPFKHLNGVDFDGPKGKRMMEQRLRKNHVSIETDVEPKPVIEQEPGKVR